jgi:hypothetical protein
MLDMLPCLVHYTAPEQLLPLSCLHARRRSFGRRKDTTCCAVVARRPSLWPMCLIRMQDRSSGYIDMPQTQRATRHAREEQHTPLMRA